MVNVTDRANVAVRLRPLKLFLRHYPSFPVSSQARSEFLRFGRKRPRIAAGTV
jgi:hypothetical protein